MMARRGHNTSRSIPSFEPQAKFLNNGHHLVQALPILCKSILHLDGYGRIDRALDKVRFFKCTEIEGKHPLRDARHQTSKFVKPLWSVHEKGDDKQAPASTE